MNKNSGSIKSHESKKFENFAKEPVSKTANEESNVSPTQNINDINAERNNLKKSLNNDSTNPYLNSENILNVDKEDSEGLLFDKTNVTKIEPWEIASTFPESVVKGTEVKIYPFPNDITKEEIYENFNLLGEIVDINIKPISKESNLKIPNNNGIKEINILKIT
jgi:hypothetical protein